MANENGTATHSSPYRALKACEDSKPMKAPSSVTTLDEEHHALTLHEEAYP